MHSANGGTCIMVHVIMTPVRLMHNTIWILFETAEKLPGQHRHEGSEQVFLEAFLEGT